MRPYGAATALAVLFTVLPGIQAVAGEVSQLRADVCIVGGGSGGLGAAIAAARAAAHVILVERQDRLGGTSVRAYVSNWEPGPGDSIAREIYDRLRKLPDAVGITTDHNADRSQGPFGLWLPVPGLTYEETLRRAGLTRSRWRAVVFDPDAFSQVVSEMLTETGHCRTLLATSFVEAESGSGKVLSIKAESADGTAYRIRGRVFIDCTGGGHLCRALGCETMLGPDGAGRFHEPSAPEVPGNTLNAISLCYRIRKSRSPLRQAEPEPPVEKWPRSAHVSGLPSGDLLVNPLAMLPGRALVEQGYDACMDQCKRIVQAHWRWLQTHPTFSGYEFHSYAPMLGIRESYRVVGEYVLTQHDLTSGLGRQAHADVIAVADHAMDVHGEGRRRVRGELNGPYGVPYRCLVPRGWDNLLVAGRGASFSHIAASSCRLSRTMIALGHAAGLAASMAARSDLPVAEIDVAALQKELDIPLPQGTR